MKNRIPKIIHYCWFGRNPLPQSVLECMKSWKEHLGDYELVLWNEDNFDITSNQYVYEAYQSKKWAFVSDYVRLHALYNFGGVYMDTDVEVLKDFDIFLNHRFFAGFESIRLPEMIGTGLLGSEKCHPLIESFLDHYNELSFYNADGTLNTTLNTTTNVVRLRNFLENQYHFVGNGEYANFGEDINIYPYDYFSAFNGTDYQRPEGCYDITENTYAIHKFSGSWTEKRVIKKKKKSQWVKFRDIIRGK